MGALRDLDRLRDRFVQGAVLAAHVRYVAAAARRGRHRECDHFVCVRVDPGVVRQSRGEAEDAVREFGLEQRLHRRDRFIAGLAAEVVAHDLPPQRAVPGVGRHIDRRRGLFQRREEVADREPRAPVLSGDDGRDPLAHHRQRRELVQQAAVVVAVRVDEPRGEDEAAGVVDRLAVRGCKDVASVVAGDFRDHFVDHTQGTDEAGAPRAVHDRGATDEKGSRTRRGGGVFAAGEPWNQGHQTDRCATSAFPCQHVEFPLHHSSSSVQLSSSDGRAANQTAQQGPLPIPLNPPSPPAPARSPGSAGPRSGSPDSPGRCWGRPPSAAPGRCARRPPLRSRRRRTRA